MQPNQKNWTVVLITIFNADLSFSKTHGYIKRAIKIKAFDRPMSK